MKFATLIISLFLIIGCKPGTNEDQTAEHAEATTEEEIGAELEDDAEALIEAYAHSMIVLDYGELAISKENLPDTVLKFAQVSANFHKKLNLQIARMVEGTNITLPLEVGEDVKEFKKDLTELEGQEFVDEYLSAVQDIQGTMEAEFREGFSTTENNALREFAVTVLPAFEEQQKNLEATREVIAEESK